SVAAASSTPSPFRSPRASCLPRRTVVLAAEPGAPEQRRHGWIRAGRVAAVAGVLCHAAAIGFRCVELHRAPFATAGESLSLLALLVVVAYLLADAVWRISAAGPFALGIGFLLVLLAGIQPDTGVHSGHHPLLEENAVSLHILAMLSAFAAFALAFTVAVLYLIERRILRSKDGLAWRRRLPPLGLLEKASLALVALGFPLLTLGILSGVVRAAGGGMGPGWWMDPKTVLALVLWGVYGLFLMSRLLLRWTAQRAAWILVAGLVLCAAVLVVPTATHRFEGAEGQARGGSGG
ncbi:MAG: cytochrome c biogenesis protein CcsA, partial [Armatimonadota bacterium]